METEVIYSFQAEVIDLLLRQDAEMKDTEDVDEVLMKL